MGAPRRSQQIILPALVGLIALGADQASKYWIVQTLGPDPGTGALPLLAPWVRLIYAQNTGIAFSLFQGVPQLFTLVALCIAGGLAVIYWRSLPKTMLVQLSVGCIEAGAFGNVLDRIRLGYVVDFIQVGWWPVFNVADSAVFVGVALLSIALFQSEMTEQQPTQAPTV